MDIKELLDEDAFDPKKLFDEKQYSTLIIDRSGFSKKENNTADLLEALLDKEITRTETEEIFSKLKETNSQNLLVSAIKKAERLSERTKLTAACWETGLDFTPYFLFFTELVCHENFELALEALSVVESCEGLISQQELAKALAIADNCKSGNEELIGDLAANIRSRII
jgi:hypothetical protein